MSNDELLDILLDLEHDLIKYLRLPLSLVQVTDSPEIIRETLRKALFETHKGMAGTRSARVIWMGFLDESRGAMDKFKAFGRLTQCANRMLAWEAMLLPDSPQINLDEVKEDVGCLAKAMTDLIAEVSNAG
jgi:hypothetical protein